MIGQKSLPVWESRQKILDALKDNNVIIVESPTGSGKTTQLPLILKEAGYAEKGIIGITQPRRIATLSVCSYIHNSLKDANLSDNYCAYKMRFYDTTDTSTRIKVLTDGMLLQELKADPKLSAYSVIMVDEAHERSLNIDFILGLLKDILAEREDLKVIISSATINTKIFADFFRGKNGNPSPIVSIKAKTYNVDVKYFPLKKQKDPAELSYSICRIINVLLKKFRDTDYTDNQDTLVFLPGELDIKTVIQDLYANCDYRHLQIYPLYGRLNKEEQERVFEQTEKSKMKVVLATNIAETSLTIDGIKVVIDSGLAKINFYNQRDFTSSLVTKPISRSSALQRTGRAGRTSDGTCYRLYTEEDFKARSLYTQEEILRTDLSEVVLRMVDLGIKDFDTFKYITKPSSEALASGVKTLKLLGAIDNEHNLTSIGEVMVRYPLLPRHSRCIVQAVKNDPEIIRNICICVSFLSCKTPFVLPPGEEDSARSCHRRFSSEFGDFIGYQILFEKYISLTQKKREEFCNLNYLDYQSMEEIVHVSDQLCQITSDDLGVIVHDTKVTSDEGFAKRIMLCLSTGLIQYVCVKKKTSSYRTVTTDEIYIHPGSAWFRNPPQYLLAGEIVMTAKMYARTVSPLKYEWIKDVYPDFTKKISSIAEKQKQKVTSVKDSKSVSVFNRTYSVTYTTGKKPHPVVIVPYTDLGILYKNYRTSRRRPKNFNAAILFNGCFVSFGESLYDIARLAGRIDFTQNIVKTIPDNVYYTDNIHEMVPYLGSLLKLSRLTKYKDRLGFVELVTSGHGIFFHVNNSFTEAVNNTAYSLQVIMDEAPEKAFKSAYNRVISLID